METKTGHVKAISNLGRGSDEFYYETTNYAVTDLMSQDQPLN
jgi:cell division protein FtsI (penicillin-binding protein 3)